MAPSKERTAGRGVRSFDLGRFFQEGGDGMEKKLTERQRRFADAYLELGNAAKAAERAGYSPGSAG